jgi:hypothetical protein
MSYQVRQSKSDSAGSGHLTHAAGFDCDGANRLGLILLEAIGCICFNRKTPDGNTLSLESDSGPNMVQTGFKKLIVPLAPDAVPAAFPVQVAHNFGRSLGISDP